jgi:hypothetical protein
VSLRTSSISVTKRHGTRVIGRMLANSLQERTRAKPRAAQQLNRWAEAVSPW